MATILGAVALGTDVAVLYYNWVQLQKGADAAVLAGANYLTGDATTDTNYVIQVTDQYAQQNGIQPAEIVSTTVASDYKSVSIVVSRTVPYFFARVLGLASGGVAARATAGINATAVPTGIMPIGLDCPTAQASEPNCGFASYTPGSQPISLKLPPGGQVGAGNWEPLALGGSGGATYRSNITNGYQASTPLDSWVSAATQPGELVGPTDQGFNARMKMAGATSYSQTPTTDPSAGSSWQLVLVPMIDFNNQNGKGQVEILGFAEFFVTGVDQFGTITGYFMGAAPNGGMAGTTPCDPGDAWPINSCTPVLLQ
jgi:Putative Tad-like Flp pilus-assembly